MNRIGTQGFIPTVIRALCGIGLAAAMLVASNRAAHADFSVPNGNWYQSDPWGAAFDPSGSQSVWTDSYGFGASWTWHYGNQSYDAIKAYPSWVVGWTFGGSYPGTDHHGFPIKVNTNPNIPTKWAYSMTGNNIYDASFDVWVANTSNAQYPSGEIMVWLNLNGLVPIQNFGHSAAGQHIYDAHGNAAPGTYTVYWGNTNDGNGHTWPVWSFVLDPQYRTTSWNSNLAPFINNVAANNSGVPNMYVMGVQGGIEIANSQGGSGSVHTNWGDFWSAAN